jgi:hypothetical protein
VGYPVFECYIGDFPVGRVGSNDDLGKVSTVVQGLIKLRPGYGAQLFILVSLEHVGDGKEPLLVLTSQGSSVCGGGGHSRETWQE